MDFSTGPLRPLMFSEHWGKEVERRMVQTMDQLQEFAFNQDNADVEEELEPPVTPSGAHFCGCPDCVVREMTYLAMQLALEGHNHGLIELTDY